MNINNWSSWEYKVEWVGKIPFDDHRQQELTLDLDVDIMAVLVKYDWYNLYYEDTHLQPYITRDLLRESLEISNKRRRIKKFKPFFFFNIDIDLLKAAAGLTMLETDRLSFFSLIYYEKGTVVTKRHSKVSYDNLLEALPNDLLPYRETEFSLLGEISGFPFNVAGSKAPSREGTQEKPYVEIAITTCIDIWFTKVLGWGADRKKTIFLDNHELARLNRPRLNGAISEIKDIILKYGGTWELGTPYPNIDRVTDEGIFENKA